MTKYSMYQRIIDRQIPPEESELPLIDLKDNKLHKVNREIRNTKLPILYRYTSISMNEIKNLIYESVYLVPAQWMNDTLKVLYLIKHMMVTPLSGIMHACKQRYT